MGFSSIIHCDNTGRSVSCHYSSLLIESIKYRQYNNKVLKLSSISSTVMLIIIHYPLSKVFALLRFFIFYISSLNIYYYSKTIDSIIASSSNCSPLTFIESLWTSLFFNILSNNSSILLSKSIGVVLPILLWIHF